MIQKYPGFRIPANIPDISDIPDMSSNEMHVRLHLAALNRQQQYPAAFLKEKVARTCLHAQISQIQSKPWLIENSKSTVYMETQ